MGEALEGVAGPHYHCYTLRDAGMSWVLGRDLFLSPLEVWVCAFITTESKNSCGKSRRPPLHPNTEQLPVPPTQGKPSMGDKQVLLTHKTNKWSHFICVESALRQSIKYISRANFPFLLAPCETSFDSWSTAVWKKTNTHIYSPDWKWLPRSWSFLLPPGHPNERTPALLYPQMSPALSSAPVMPWGPSISWKKKSLKNPIKK